MKLKKTENEKRKVKKFVKKLWANTTLHQLEKKYTDLLKNFDDIKDTDSDEIKMEKLTALNFINRILNNIKEVLALSTAFNVYGFASVC